MKSGAVAGEGERVTRTVKATSLSWKPSWSSASIYCHLQWTMILGDLEIYSPLVYKLKIAAPIQSFYFPKSVNSIPVELYLVLTTVHFSPRNSDRFCLTYEANIPWNSPWWVALSGWVRCRIAMVSEWKFPRCMTIIDRCDLLFYGGWHGNACNGLREDKFTVIK